ncbi:TRAP transporter substrate-binding protein [Oceanicoccus sagamiensis]|uniref:ABC transporter substrate-binding protein n=1 Tax=Oceanicoccus sagamiensis TaxID=716816 RepID=A0A1X9NCI3_9GAMM|nr:TRAP transporter substrate-binding protein [Oceanicoccus sagamiensis]ARN74132.1 ABC transporter substrate-binding protein [Oceanicoccus sagamiensis]
MSTSYNRFSPLIILALVAALVTVSWLLVIERAAEVVKTGNVESVADGRQQTFQWKMVTTWPKNFPGLGTAPENFAKVINEMSNGRLTVKVYGGGEIVPALEVFSAVSQGTAEMGHGAAYYWKGKIPSSPFFTSVPFGLTAQEMNGWLHYGGGLELWREAYAPFNIIPFAGGNTGVQMAGWFNREINSIDDIKGLKMRVPGVGGEVFSRAGGTAVTLPGSELYTSLQTGVIDATEWVAPYNDMALGLHEVAKYYYYPGWHEPGPTLELIINKDAYDSLPEDLQKMVEIAARYANQDMLDEYTARNNASLLNLQANHDTELRKLPDDVLRALHKASNEYLIEVANEDPMAAKVYKSWRAYADGVKNYHHISEQAYINARDL